MARGHVVHWDPIRRFGKIAAVRREWFVHRDSLVDVVTLTVGQAVEFDPIETERGPRAENVRVLEAR